MKLKTILEGILFAISEPISIKELSNVIHEYNEKEIEEALKELSNEYQFKERAIELIETQKGWRFQTKRELKDWIKRFVNRDEIKLSNAALEVIAILLCKEPTTRAQIEAIRGIDSSYILRQLLELDIVKIVGRKEVIGRPLLYALSPTFWETFSIKNKEEFFHILKESLSDEEKKILDGLSNN